jgi:hypothetical protein
MGSAQKLPQNITTPKNLQFSALSKDSSSVNSKKNYHPRESISLFSRSRQTNIPVNMKASIIERRQIDLRDGVSSAKKGLQPTQNLTTKVFEIQLDVDITSSNSDEKFNDSTIIEANEDETVVVSNSSKNSQD